MLIGHGADLRGVVQKPGDEGAPGRRQLVLAGWVVEGVAVAFEQGEMRVHAATRMADEGFRHEGGQAALLESHLFDDGAEGHDVVGHGQGVGEPQVDLVLAGAALVVGELHGDAHLLEHEDRPASELVSSAARNMVEVPGVVGGGNSAPGVPVDEVELDLGMDVAGEAGVGDLCQLTFQDSPRVGAHGLAVGCQDIAEHAGDAVGAVAPGQHLEGRRVRGQQHVRLVDAGEPLDGRAVEADALLECALHLRRGDGHGLQLPQDVGEPQADEADVALLDRPQNVLLLLVHVHRLPERGPWTRPNDRRGRRPVRSRSHHAASCCVRVSAALRSA